GMTKEGVIRKVRFLNNQYDDSVKDGSLWEELAD
ncbi:MAG: N-acetyltransferase, partial [Enterococcus faecium]